MTKTDKKTVTNTETQEKREDWVLGRNPQAIEDQEARGQKELAESDVLPALWKGGIGAELMAKGVVFGERVPGDQIFCYATLPPGWSIKPHEDHTMWSDLIDENGVAQVSIFYKAAFYDRSASISPPVNW